MSRFRRLLAARYVPVILSAIIGSFVTIGAFLLVCSWEYRVAVIDFQSKAKSYLEVINADLDEANSLLYTIAAFIGSNDHAVTANDFARFSAALHRRVSGLRDTAWAPRVMLAERPKFERDARAAGIVHYEVRQFGQNRKLVRAAPRPAYYPLLYIESGGAKRAMLGFDLISEKLRARVVKHALATGLPAATPPMDVNTVRQRGAGVLSYMPVYRSASSGADGSQAPRGLVLGVFDIPALVKNIFEKRADSMHGLNLYLFNPAARAARRVIYRTASADGPAATASEQALRAGAHSESTVLLIDEQLGAIVTPAQQLQGIRWSLFGILTLIVGFTMTAMIITYLLLSIRRTMQLEALTTGLQASAEQITQMSRHDALTGMPNRVLFQERMEQALARFGRGAPFALLFLDLDRFKAVNDTLGHGAGDQLLCAVAGRINDCVRETDTAARLGGDEFAVLLADMADSPAISVAAHRLIESISKPYMIGNESVIIGVSIGAAIAAQGATAEDIVAEADLAMYEAKAAGRGTLRLFERNLRSRVDEKRVLENDLRSALERSELEVHYQPLLNLADSRVSAFEALVRWKHPEHGMISPARFIPIAEECGLIGQLGAWVLRTACEDAAGWPEAVKVAVNISPVQLKQTTLLGEIVEILTSSGLPPGRLELELTEAAVLNLEDSGTTLAMLMTLRELGVVVAFDDFGTGYSSLSSLLRFPFDKIKVDRSFVQNSETSASAAAIVRAVVGLGASLDLTTTGEGVETMTQLQSLRNIGCTEAQGYLFSPARPNVEVPSMLRLLDGTFTCEHGCADNRLSEVHV
jgi:diguanylate cyclase (GGDEF)-like protein